MDIVLTSTAAIPLLLGYIGPGPGLGLTWALIGLVATVVSAVVAILLWPMRAALRSVRGGEDAATADDAEQDIGADGIAPASAPAADGIAPAAAPAADDPARAGDVTSAAPAAQESTAS